MGQPQRKALTVSGSTSNWQPATDTRFASQGDCRGESSFALFSFSHERRGPEAEDYGSTAKDAKGRRGGFQVFGSTENQQPPTLHRPPIRLTGRTQAGGWTPE